MKYVYVVTVNDKISSEAYDSIEKAQAYIRKQSGISKYDRPFGKDEYVIIEENGYRYEIHDVKVV